MALRPGFLPCFGALVFLLACGGSSSTHAPDGPRDLTGSAQTVAWTSAGSSTAKPVDLSAHHLEAIFPTAQGWDIYGGVGDQDGTFRIPGVPASGTYWLRDSRWVEELANEFFLTDADSVDLGRDVNYHRMGAAPEGTRLILGGSGLDPVQEHDVFGILVPTAGLVYGDQGYDPDVADFLSPLWTLNRPQAMATTLSGTLVDWTAEPPINGDQGDRVTLAQYRRTQQGDVAYDFIVASADLPTFSMTPGIDTQVTGLTFTPPPAQPYVMDWPRSQWDALREEVGGPDTQTVGFDGWISVQNGGLAHGLIDNDLPIMNLRGLPEGLTDFRTTDLGLRNPYPAAWAFEHYEAWFLSPSPDGMSYFQSLLTLNRPLGPGTPIQPVLSPPRDLRINGLALTGTLTDVGTSPVLSWTAPRIGQPTSYVVRVLMMGGFGASDVAALWVPGDVTSITFPPDVLRKEGRSYTVQVIANDMTRQDIRKAPRRIGLGRASATCCGLGTFLP